MKRFRATFCEGLFFFVPLVLTAGFFYFIFKTLYRFVAAGAAYIPLWRVYREYPWVERLFEAGIFLCILVIIITAGLAAETIAGRFLRKKLDRFFRAIPFVNFIYDIFSQIFDVLFTQSDKLLSRPVLVPFPEPGRRTIGFMTGVAEPELSGEPGREYIKVFIPTVPIPTTGFTLIFPRDQVIEGALTAEEALRLVLSGGLLDETEGNKP